MPKIKGRIFVVGCARSGTTLLQTLIASHPSITTFPETKFFSKSCFDVPVLKSLNIARLGGYYNVKSFFDEINSKSLASSFKIHDVISLNLFARKFISKIDEIAISRGANYWVEKTPLHLRYIEEIEKYVTDPKFVHVVRRGEDVVASMYDVTHKYPDRWGGARSLVECIQRWKTDVQITLHHLNLNNHCVVHYEDLIDNTEQILQGISQFLRIKYDRRMQKNHSNTASKITLDREEWKNRNEESISRGVNKFSFVFDEKEKNIVRLEVEELNGKIEDLKI
jgi:hypothetical protein